MEKVLPVIIICGVGIVACLAYIVAVCVKAIKRRPRRVREFEIEDDVLVIKLDKKGSKK